MNKYYVTVCFWDIEAENVKQVEKIIKEKLSIDHISIIDIDKIKE